MSTQINVTVDQGGLLEQNRQQVTANRQSAIDGSKAEQVSQEAEQKRSQRLEAEGLNADGTPKDTNYRLIRIDRKPGANRNNPKKVYFGPRYAAVDTPSGIYLNKNYLLDSIKKRGPGLNPSTIQANRFYYRVQTYNIVGGFLDSSIVAGEQSPPGGAPALRLIGNGGQANIYPVQNASTNIGIIDRAVTYECYIRQANLPEFQLQMGTFSFAVDEFGSTLSYASPSGSLENVSVPLSTTNFEQWAHLALVFSKGKYNFYYNGVRKSLIEIMPNDPSGYLSFDTLLFGRELLGYDQTIWISSVRVVNKALYRSLSFTPPLSSAIR